MISVGIPSLFGPTAFGWVATMVSVGFVVLAAIAVAWPWVMLRALLGGALW